MMNFIKVPARCAEKLFWKQNVKIAHAARNIEHPGASYSRTHCSKKTLLYHLHCQTPHTSHKNCCSPHNDNSKTNVSTDLILVPYTYPH